MAIINRNKVSLDRPKIENKEINSVAEEKEIVPKKGTRKYSASERLNVKVNPPALEKMKLIGRFEGGKIYENMDKIIDYYLENKFEDRDKRILDKLIEKSKN